MGGRLRRLECAERIAKLVLSVCLLVALLLASACGRDEGGPETDQAGSASPAPELTTYSNEEWSFSLEYPVDWAHGDLPADRQLGEFKSDFFIVFTDDPSILEEPPSDGRSRGWVTVAGVRMPTEGSESDFRALLADIASQLERLIEQRASGGVSAEVTDVTLGHFAGVPAVISEASAGYHSEPGERQRQYTFGKGDVLYFLSLNATADRWSQYEAELESIAQSFAFQQ